ncbi:MAG TPA: NAD(P)/FAD-dependent oxidoreductase [Acidimicrobiales bacterium]|nr:NAD(P)/FAD-dependent oxidoreductase [Acidimicrobiales bacterium]
MSDYDAIVIGAGHNGLTAAAVMARGGMRVLCLEKNHFIGGMSATTELARGYRFELAGSIQFPIPNEIYDDLGFASCPMYEPAVQSSSIGPSGEPPLFLYSDPERLLEHLSEALGMEAVLGMAEVAAWAEAPARAIGRFDVRKPPKSLDEMWACASNEQEREAIRTAMFGSVMDVVDRYLPDREKHGQVRSMLSFLAVNSTYRGPYSPGSALCLAFALASPGDATMSKVRGGIGAMSDHILKLFQDHGGQLRRHTKVSKIATANGRVEGVILNEDEVVTAPVVVSNLDPTATFTHLLDRNDLPASFVSRVDAIDHRAAYFQIHFALNGLPEFVGPYEVLNDDELRRNVTLFGTAEQMQRDFEGCVRGVVPPSPSFNIQIPSLEDPTLAPPGKHAASGFAFYFPIGATRDDHGRLRDEMAERIVTKFSSVAPNFPDLIDRQFNYPAYTYELMFGCTGGDFTHGLLQPEFMGPFRPGPRGWPDNPIPIDGLFLCGAGCHGGPGITFIPGYNCGYAVLEMAGSRSLSL